MEPDTTRWSGEGAFTQVVIDAISRIEHVAFLRAEDAPSTRSEADYNFVSNEVYVGFETRERLERVRRFGFLPGTRSVLEKASTMRDLEALLYAIEDIGPPDYADEVMLQYMRTERIIPPYQTRGYKLVELVRVYEVDRASDG